MRVITGEGRAGRVAAAQSAASWVTSAVPPPRRSQLSAELDRLGVKLMVSIWPTVNSDGTVGPFGPLAGFGGMG